jgi:hypothetical protein
MMDVFLAASVPLPERDRRFFDTADVLLIRDAIKAVVDVVLPVGRITSGGHPAITPLLTHFIREGGLNAEQLTIYQSAYFAPSLPPANRDLADVRMTPIVESNRELSLARMRSEMISSRVFNAAVVIGGMEGVLDEIRLFQHSHPGALVLPFASTGAAAAIIYNEGAYDTSFATDLTFASVLRRRLQF